MYVAAVRSWTSNCPCRKPPVRDTGHKTEFQIYPSVYLPPHHHLTIPDSRTPNAPQISSHEIMSVCSSDAGNSWGQSKHGCPQFCPLMKVGSRSAGRGRGLACPPQCVPTQLWPSQGSYWILPSWLRFQVRLGAPGGNLCQVYSVSVVSRAGVRRCFATLVQQTAQTRTLFFPRWYKNNDIVMWYAIKGLPPPYQTVYGAFITGCKYLVINTAEKTDLSVHGIWPSVCHTSCRGNCANWPSWKKSHRKFFK